MQFEPLPEKRPVPAFVKRVPAQDVMLEWMKSGAAEKEACSRELAREQKRADDLAVSLALQVHRKRASDDAYLRGLLALLTDRNVELLTYEGDPLTNELENSADIVEWLPAEGNEAACVAEAIEPEIRWQGRILHRAKLSCRKAPEHVPEAEPARSDGETRGTVGEIEQKVPESGAEPTAKTALQQTPAEQPPAPSKKRGLFRGISAIWSRLRHQLTRPRGSKPATSDAANTDAVRPDGAQEGSRNE